MLYTIRSGSISAAIHSRGAELWSLTNTDGLEYLWQGDPDIWADRAPNLFPYIARLTHGRYTVGGRTYHMDIHGFLKDSTLRVVDAQPHSIRFLLEDSASTLAQYPFPFALEVAYTAVHTTLTVTYTVRNTGDGAMYFGIGGHPGFRVPLLAGEKFTDYRLAFAQPCSPLRVGMSDDCFVTGQDVPYPLEGGRYLPLTHDLFDNDALILRDTCRSVTLENPRGRHSVTVWFAHMPYLGLWHRPHTQAQYLCIEPWSSLPSRKDVVEDLSTQPGLVALPPGETYVNEWGITLDAAHNHSRLH